VNERAAPFQIVRRRDYLPRHGGTRHTYHGGADMTYTKPSLKRLGSLAELTLSNASCDYSQQY
jgi:hypothetical protein